jgi:hypothetical protein
MAASLTWRAGLQHSKAATAARRCQKRRKIEPKLWHSPPFRINGCVEPIKVSQLGDVSLDAGNIVSNGFRRLVELLLATARDEDVSPLLDEELGRCEGYSCGTTSDDRFSL